MAAPNEKIKAESSHVPTEEVARTVVSLRRKGGHRAKSAAAHRRMIVKVTEVPRDGSALLKQINLAIAQRGETVEEAAVALGISPVYLRSLANGNRSIADVDRRVLEAAAEYIGMPVAQVFLLAGVLAPEHFFHKNSMPTELSAAHKAMQAHPLWAGYAPSDAAWNALGDKEKLFVTMLFETATSQKFLTAAGIPDIS